jgi:outer membrane protein OmpA-like peptidoglycan-associated protein
VPVQAQQLNFVACPIVRDTKTVPCFLAEHDGETYFLGVQQDITADFHPPQLKHEVLVEGQVAPGPRICGGIPLQPVAVSVLKEIKLSCNTLLPAEPGIEAPPAPRGAGPASKRPEIATATKDSLSGQQEFTIPYSFDSAFLEYAGNRVLSEAAAYALRIKAKRVKVTGYRASTLLSNGTRLVEKDGLAETRAQDIGSLLRGLGVAGVTIEGDKKSEPADGQTQRRVTIDVTP